MIEHAVIIVGAGPTGLMLAGELALAGVDVALVERRPDQTLAGSRAGGLHARTLEILDQRGIVERFLEAGQVAQVAMFGGTRLDLADCPTRFPHGLGLWQNQIERLLAGWVAEFKVPVHHGCEVSDLIQDENGVTLTLADGRALRAQYAVGCDGGRSRIRKVAGIAFPGWDATTSSLIAEVEMAETPPLGVHRSAFGTYAFGRAHYAIRDGEVVYGDAGPIRAMVTEATVGLSTAPTLDDLKAALIAACGQDYGAHSPTWLSRFSDATRQAEAYRSGRVLLAGDAAHIHSPDGGQGLNTGVQDAVNLGWKLAQVVKGVSAENLLDTYHAERHPVGARMVRHTMAQVALRRSDARSEAVRDVVTELLALDEPKKRFAAMQSGLDIRYDLGEGHPLLGRRVPDLDLVTGDGPVRLYTRMHDARPLLLDLAGDLDLGAWSDRVRRIEARYDGPWALPVVGEVAAPSAVLVRPDGHVAWVGMGDGEGPEDALTAWLGPPGE